MPTEGRTRHELLCSGYLLAIFTLGILCVASPGYAQNRNLVVAPVNPANRAVLAGHRPAWASALNDIGAVPADQFLRHFEFVLARSPEQQQAFDQFLRQQQDPASPNYHHWLTPVEIGERFGATQNDLDAITNWLQSLNFHVDAISNSRVRIQFSGPASSIANAFGSELHYYRVNGEQRYSISAEPQIPAALSGIIKSISGLYIVNVRPFHGYGTARVPAAGVAGENTNSAEPAETQSNGAHFLFPGDFATIYDLPTSNITGAGQTIAVIGESRVYAQDITNFQTLSGLAGKAQTEIIPPPVATNDPGPAETSPPTSGSPSQAQGEATLDVTRSTSIAPGATIDLVVSSSKTGGIATASEYVVDTVPVFAQIMTISFGGCESQAGLSGDDFWDSIFAQASMEGISVFVASGDAGVAGCDSYFATPPASQSASINYICASSHATCVGGTEFADTSNPAAYWATNNGANSESALSYIPEGGWNEPGTGSAPIVAASGGGVSAFIPTPPWQTGSGVPGTVGRYTPDVAFSSAAHDGYFACFAAAQQNSCVLQNGSLPFIYFYGTSAAAPGMAGIAALLNQKLGAPQGELNSTLYRLAATPSNNVFHDVTVASSGVSGCTLTIPSMCNNSTPGPTSQTGGLPGYQVGTGYDEVTGLGSIDVGNFLATLSVESTATTVVSSLNPAVGGQTVMFTATVTATGGTPTGTVTFFNGSNVLGMSSLSGGVATFATTTLGLGSDSITASYSNNGNSDFIDSTSPALTETVNIAGFAPVTAQPVTAGSTETIPITVYEAAGSGLQFQFTCVGLSAKATCVFGSNSFTPGPPPNGTTFQLMFGTASSKLPARPPDRNPTPWGTLVILAGVSALLAAGTLQEKFVPRLRLVFGSCVTIILLAMFMTSCGGAGTPSTPPYTGTPKGTSMFTITGTSGAVTISTTVTVTVN